MRVRDETAREIPHSAQRAHTRVEGEAYTHTERDRVRKGGGVGERGSSVRDSASETGASALSVLLEVGGEADGSCIHPQVKKVVGILLE